MHHIVYLQKSRDAYEREWQQQQTKEKREERAAKVKAQSSEPRIAKEYAPVYVPPGKRSARNPKSKSSTFATLSYLR